MPAASPTRTRARFNGISVVRVMKILGVAVNAIDDRISQANHGGAPITLAHPPMLWISDAFGQARPQREVRA